MIFHQTKCMDLPRGLGASLAEGEEKALAIEIVLEDRFAAIAAIHDVVNGAGIFDTKLAGHAGKISETTRLVNTKTYESG
jgi:hypothetical protein